MTKCDFCDKKAIHSIEYENLTRISLDAPVHYDFCSFHFKLKIKQILKKNAPDKDE